jgi:hypothetical protein
LSYTNSKRDDFSEGQTMIIRRRFAVLTVLVTMLAAVCCRPALAADSKRPNIIMLLTDAASIRDVILFPHMRPEERA